MCLTYESITRSCTKCFLRTEKNCLRYILEQKQSYVCQSDREELHFLHLHENSLYIPAI